MKPNTDQPVVAERPHVGQPVTWFQQRTWGGKQGQPAKYVHAVGVNFARILVLGEQAERTVRLKNLRWSND